MRNFVQDGEKLAVVTPYDVRSGDVVVVNQLKGVAVVDGAEGDEVTVSTRGVYELAKDRSEASVGEPAYYHSETGVISALKDETGVEVGYFVKNAKESQPTVQVKIG